MRSGLFYWVKVKTNEAIIKKYHLDGKKVVTRQQVDVIQGDSKHGSVKKNDQGFLVGTAPIAKVGVMDYLLADGSILSEFLPPEALFDKESMATLELKPVTDQHPFERLVNSKNAAFRTVGSTGQQVTKEDDFLISSLVITDGDLVESIEDGAQQDLSPGYTVGLIFQDGEHEGRKFQAIQVGRAYNHVAIVDSARGGPEITLSLDSAKIDKKSAYGYEIRTKTDSKPQISIKERPMKKISVNNIDYDAEEEVINHVDKLTTEIATGKTALETLKATNDTALAKLQGEHDVLKTKVDELGKVDHKAEARKQIDARLGLERLALEVLNKDTKEIEKIEDRELKIDMVLEKYPALKEKIIVHNALIALAVTAAASEQGLDASEIARGLSTFEGVKRRMEERGTVDGVTVLDDFAHHPTAIAATLGAVRRRFPGRRVWAICEPRSWSLRRNVFQERLVDALQAADEIVLAAVYGADQIDESERLDPDRLASELGRRGRSARFVPEVEEIVSLVGKSAESGDVVVIMSNGAFDGLHGRILEALHTR